MQSIRCPNCNSDNISSFEITYKNSGNELLTKQTAPPYKPAFGAMDLIVTIIISFLALTVGVVFVGIFAGLLGLGRSFVLLSPFFVVIGAPVGYVLVRFRKINFLKKFWQQDNARWHNSWLCFQCGNSWAVENGIVGKTVIKIRRILDNELSIDMSILSNEYNFNNNLAFILEGNRAYDRVNLFMKIEEEFNIKITENESEQVNTVEEIINLVCRKLG